MTAADYIFWGIVLALVLFCLFFPIYRYFEKGLWVCADCHKDFDNRLKAIAHRGLSLFTMHLVVKERRCEHVWGPFVAKADGGFQKYCMKCERPGPFSLEAA